MSKRNARILASTIGAACFAILMATSPTLPMAWDEGNAIDRAEGIQRWFGRFGASWSEPFSKGAIEADWRYTTHVEGHPALYGILIALGDSISRRWLSPLTAARCAPMLLFSLAASAAAYRLCRTVSPVAAFVGVTAMVSLPRLFAHAHFASFDGPLMSCWILAWAIFEPALCKAGWSVVWGAALGATMSCKFTGFLAPLPFMFWTIAFGGRKAARALAIGLPTAAATFYVLNPPLWHGPLAGMGAFFDLNLGRAERPDLNIPTTYFGARYDARTPLPWHNSLVWTAITVPVGTLSFFVLGLGRVLRNWRSRPEWLLLAGNWAILVVARATPWAPPHDAERLFLPSFAFLALLAGIGGDAIWGWGGAGGALRRARRAGTNTRVGSSQPERRKLGCYAAAGRRCLARAAVVGALTGAVTSSVWYAPQWLSYYNLLVGGLRGADALGMEATYYWDGLDAEALGWLHEHTANDERVLFGSPSLSNLNLMRRWDVLHVACLPGETGRYRWYIIQRRPSTWSKADRRLVTGGRPAFRKTIRRPDTGWGPWRLDVAIIEVYDFDRYMDAALSAE
ncbi:MAG TPA: glycosyltransferase family 39 protein [Pirellulales bacterium]|nr:glycosyltransferase family 39 protein [Pirellulales bacterium]